MTDPTAILERLRAQQDALQSLFTAVESGLADVVLSLENNGKVLSALGAIEAAVVDMTTAVERDATSTAIGKLTEAVSAMHSREMPAPNITVEAIMPAAPVPARTPWVFDVEYDSRGLRVMKLTATPMVQ